MSVITAAIQDLFTAYFQEFTLRTPDRTPSVSSVCGFTPRGGTVNQGDAAREKAWTATVTLPARSTLELQADERVSIDEHAGRVYRVVWAPGPDVFNLERTYGVVEV